MRQASGCGRAGAARLHPTKKCGEWWPEVSSDATPNDS
jgi:hypothetical protein